MLKNLVLIFFYFTLSTVLTWWFIVISPLYIDVEQMLWSCGIAGGKWMLQLIAAFVLLKDEKKWDFMRRIGFVCLIGSLILAPFCLAASFRLADHTNFFISSLIASVLCMIFLYYRAVRQTNTNLFWWIGWLFCLVIAVSLQLTVVFNLL